MTKQEKFGNILRDLLIERDIVTGSGNANWAAFAEMLDGVHYETLRKAVVGDRLPNVELMEKIATVLEVNPEVFPEYRLIQAQRLLDPREVGLDVALENLHTFVEKVRGRARR